MPNPTQSDLHVNVPLTNVSIAYKQASSSYIADKVFPKVPVAKQSDLYWKYSKSDWRRTDVQKRAPSTETPGVGWNVTTDQYFCHVYGVHKDIDDQLRANADSVFKMDSDATQFITNQLLLKRDLDWNATYFKAGVWDKDLTGVAGTPTTNQFKQWNDPTSDPIADVAQWVIDFRKNNGFKPNVMVLGAYTMAALKQHPDIIDRIKYTQKGIVTEDLIATLFDVDKLYTSYATSTPVDQIPDAKAQDAAATYDFITPSKAALLLNVPSSPSLMTPSAGYTFTWKGYLGGNSEGIKVKRFRMEQIASDRIEAESTYDMKVVCKDLGVYVGSAVA
jgi:Phage major capsid protein E